MWSAPIGRNWRDSAWNYRRPACLAESVAGGVEPTGGNESLPELMPGQGWGERYESGLAPDVSEPRYGWWLIGSATVTALGTLAPWARISKLDLTISGIHLGWFPFAAAVTVALFGLLIVRRRGNLWVSGLALALGGLNFATMIAVTDGITADQARAHHVDIEDVALGYGLWVTEVGAVLTVVSAFIAMRHRTAEPAKKYR